MNIFFCLSLLFFKVTVLTDRSQGGSSMNDGDMEIMVHRRLLYDDAFGVGEPLNESAYGQGLVVRGKHWLQYEINGEAAASQRHRFKAQEVFMDTQLTFVPTSLTFAQWQSQFPMEYSSLQSLAMPPNIHLLTLEEWPEHSENAVLLRLEHLFQADEDPSNNSRPVELKLERLFKAFDIGQVEEVTLGANLAAEKLDRLEWNVVNEVPSPDGHHPRTPLNPQNGWTVTLRAFEIRTFILTLSPKTL